MKELLVRLNILRLTISSSMLSVPVFVISELPVLTPLLNYKKDVSELKKIDLSAKALAALKTQVLSVVDNYLGSKVGDVFQKELKKHTADLIQKYSLQKIPEVIEDENAMDKGLADTVQDHKINHDDDEDDDNEDPLTGPNQGSKTGKSAPAKEPVEEPITEVVMDDTGDDVVRDDDQPQDASEPKTTKSPNPDWFTQPPRPPTPDPKWNKLPSCT
ncbi:hypothetical protein Tco_1562670 [Tanacetum coccineum]